MMEEAQRIMQEMRDKGCTAQRDRDGREQEDMHKLSATDQAVLNLTVESLMVSDSALREMAELLSDAEDRVHTTQALNRRGRNAVKHLEHLQSQLGTNQKRLRPVTEIIKDLLKNITNIFLMLDETKKATMGSVTKAEEHAEELSRVAAEFQPLLHNASTISDDLLSELGIGVYNSIINAKDNAEMAASQSREAAE
ncbi:hypothetical protein CesoFtcFv8_005154 [Champsocephalus esox]|uniref:Uncharacterized protein n=1 Tax=Champsocephalus esox TaxID=159716 RepID=A0AAN8CNU6_9TELE|nr:hypothetical protein CesoFtcFv8_005154 [Champsocephalus esox]